MIGRILLGAALCAGCLAGASVATAAEDHLNATAQEYRDPFYYQNNSSGNNGYGSNPAFTQGCPPGSIPQSFPNGNGRRCALSGGGYIYN